MVLEEVVPCCEIAKKPTAAAITRITTIPIPAALEIAEDLRINWRLSPNRTIKVLRRVVC